jgi:osmotically-inducible protein OsmY
MHHPARGSAWLNLGFCAIAAFGCGRQAADTSAQHRKVTEAAREESRRSDPATADVELSRQIREAMLADDQIAEIVPGVEIFVTAGEVTLRGTVPDEKRRAAIARTAQQIAGLTKVINHLELAHP